MKHDHPTHYRNIKINKLPQSEVEITGEIEAKAFEEYVAQALAFLKSNIEVEGFRKGKVPEAMVMKKVGERGLLDEAAEMALQHEYGHIVTEHELGVIGRPSIEITSIARKKPLEFKIKVAVFPEVTLPDHKKIARKEAVPKTDISVSDKEVDDMLENFKKADEKLAEKISKEADLTDLKIKIKDNLLKEKESRESEKRRIAIGKALVGVTTIELPAVLIEGEMKKMLAQFKGHIESIQGATYEQYLKEARKTEEDLKKDWKKDAEDRVALQIILNKIGQIEKILPSEEEIEAEIISIMSHYKNADKDHVRAYVETILGNEKVFEFLETLK